jgi:glutamyl-Q tRNA(Asp) synthetase
MDAQPVFRFAPSPNGELHLGHAFAALVAHDMAERAGGRFLLRIEDIDIGRCRPEFEAQILQDLAWLGLEWEQPVRRQSEHFETYRKAVAKLDAMGLLYPCFATRKQIAEAVADKGPHALDPEGAPLYPGLYRGRSAGEIKNLKASGVPHALRIDVARAIEAAAERSGGPISFVEIGAEGSSPERWPADPARWGDAVIARKDVPTSYHLAVVVDDALQGVTHVVRGQDLYAATDIHRLLQILLELPEPRYHHHRLILDDKGRKLAKSREDESLKALREAGASPSKIRRMVGLEG